MPATLMPSGGSLSSCDSSQDSPPGALGLGVQGAHPPWGGGGGEPPRSTPPPPLSTDAALILSLCLVPAGGFQLHRLISAWQRFQDGAQCGAGLGVRVWRDRLQKWRQVIRQDSQRAAVSPQRQRQRCCQPALLWGLSITPPPWRLYYANTGIYEMLRFCMSDHTSKQKTSRHPSILIFGSENLSFWA